MGNFPVFHYKQWSLKRKLFGYMLILTLLILFVLITALFLFGRFHSIGQNYYDILDTQMEVFEKDISHHYDHLAAACISLSRETGVLLEQQLTENNISFSQLTNSGEVLLQIQQALIDPLCQKLYQTSCSGIFVLLDATINDTLADSDHSRSGIYLQTTGYESTNRDILLYRGLSDIGKQFDIMPHRKWRLEFDTTIFPDFELVRSLAESTPENAFLFTSPFTLPGTSERVSLAMIPIVGSDGCFYGICGFEISESLFATNHAQPTNLAHMTCILTPQTDDAIHPDQMLCSGISSGYFRAPADALTEKAFSNGLSLFTSDFREYIGISSQITVSPNNDSYKLIVMIPKSDYDMAIRKNTLQNTVLWALILFFSASCCMLFSRRFLAPILQDLDNLKSQAHSSQKSQSPEIRDLFAFLSEKDREYEQALEELVSQKNQAQAHLSALKCQYEKAQADYQSAQNEIARLAYSRKQEIDPDDYQVFLAGIQSLTPTERKIFDYYLDGLSVKDIIAAASIKESTVRYHNQNIYSKLGVNSLKQMLRYASLMRQQENAEN